MSNQVLKFDQIMLGFRVTSINHSKKLCNVTMVIDPCNGGAVTSYNYRNIAVTSLLNWRMLHHPEKYPLNHLWVSKVHSPVFWENPLQMIRYIDKDTGLLTRKLALVTERSAKKTITKVMGFELISYEDRNHYPDYYCRLNDRVRRDDLKSFSKQLEKSSVA